MRMSRKRPNTGDESIQGKRYGVGIRPQSGTCASDAAILSSQIRFVPERHLEKTEANAFYRKWASL